MTLTKEMERCLKTPAPGWTDAKGGGAPNPRADLLAWQVGNHDDLAEKSASMVAQLSPIIERLQLGVRQSRARGEPFVLRERMRRLEVLLPELEYWGAIAKASEPWLGHGKKALDRAVQIADAAVVAAEAPIDEVGRTRQTVGRLAASAGVDAKGADAALDAIEAALGAKLKAAQKVAAAARADRDENAAELVRLERELTKARARREAVA